MYTLDKVAVGLVSGGNDQAIEIVLLPPTDETSPVHREPVQIVVPSGPLAGLIGFIQPFGL